MWKTVGAGLPFISILMSMIAKLYPNLNPDEVLNGIGTKHNLVSDFIEDNFGLFVNKFNEQNEETLNANSIEYRTEVYVIENEDYATYLDFNEDNGYLLLADHYNLLEFEITGNLDYFFGEYEVVYSIYDGFGYYWEQNFITFSSLEIETVSEDDQFESWKAYPGQKQAGSGQIENLDEYIKGRYGSGYNLKENKSLKNWEYQKQKNLSQYLKREKDNPAKTVSEGNCGLASLYTVLNYWSKEKAKNQLPKNVVNVRHEEDWFYEKLMAQQYSNGVQKWKLNEKTQPELYMTIRNWFRDANGYQTQFTSPFQYSDAIKYINHNYRTTFKSRHVVRWNFTSQVKRQINLGNPLIWNQAPIPLTPDFFGYGFHSMVIKGYKIYTKTSGWWIFKTTKYQPFIEMNDNWNLSPLYIDIIAYLNYFQNGGLIASIFEVTN